MKKLFTLLVLIIIFNACKKKNDEPPNNNELKATVVVSPVKTVIIDAKAEKAIMGCANIFGNTYTYIDGIGESDAALYITVVDANIQCITGPGTYSMDCEYRVNVNDQSTPIFVDQAGSITFTAINEKYMEGFFNAVCVYGIDSVVVSGTFKGDRLRR